MAARATAAISKRLGRGGGTVLPGHVAHRIDPLVAQHLAAQLTAGTILVTGTNGKTTTSRMIAQIAAAEGQRTVHNRSGANLMSGIRSALAVQTDWRGRPLGTLGLFEVDEANLPAACQALQPQIVVLTNLFRDQLDRYGEIDFIGTTWRAAISQLPRISTLVVNVDDPTLAQLAEVAPGRVLAFGMDHTDQGAPGLAHEADRRLCPHCGARLHYEWTYFGHIGHYDCPSCGWVRPTPDVRVTQLTTGPRASDFEALVGDQRVRFTLPLPGTYNVYNALAAISTARAVGWSTLSVTAALAAMNAVFGRQEEIRIGAGCVTITLVKNPVGFNQVLRAAQQDAAANGLVLAINDEFADGTDISWLWDVDFEMLAGTPSTLTCTGLRAHDMAVRLKYANVEAERVRVEPDLERCVAGAIARVRSGDRITVLCTYTAMLALRHLLQRLGHVPPFWET